MKFQSYRRMLTRAVFTLMIIAVLVINMACILTQSQIDKATKASGSIAHYTGDVIVTVKSLYETGVITITVKDQIAEKLKEFSIVGRDFNQLVSSVSTQYGSGTVPVAVWKDLVTHFDALVKIFVDILTFIPAAAGLKDSKAFKIITAAVVTLAQILIDNGYNKPIYRKLRQALPNWQEIQNGENGYELA